MLALSIISPLSFTDLVMANGDGSAEEEEEAGFESGRGSQEDPITLPGVEVEVVDGREELERDSTIDTLEDAEEVEGPGTASITGLLQEEGGPLGLAPMGILAALIIGLVAWLLWRQMRR